ncbi:MAG: rRNA maturation RNase YbeY [Thermodesulforhabdaceae bacterium]
MNNEVMIQNDQTERGIDLERLKKVANHVLDALGCDGVELSILLTDDTTIRNLKAQYLGIDSATDVMAFPMEDALFPGEERLKMLGDVVISVPTAFCMADDHKCSVEMVLDLLLVHGILHLIGYDHQAPEEASLMDAKTMELLTALGYDPSSWKWYLTREALPQ